MNKKVLIISVLLLTGISIQAQPQYHPDDLEGLRKFLRQPSATSGIINAQFLGVTITDTIGWYNSHNNWVNKLVGVEWNEDEEKKITKINWYSSGVSGILDCKYFIKLENLNINMNQITQLFLENCTELTELRCMSNYLTLLDVSNCTELTLLACGSNELTFLDVYNCNKLTFLACSNNQLASLNLSNCTELTQLGCSGNQLLFSKLPVFSEMEYYEYRGQYINGGEIIYENGFIDLSSEYTVGGNITQFTWFEMDDKGFLLEEITLSGASGVFLINQTHLGKRLLCSMLNETFPDIVISDNGLTSSMTYEVKIVENTNIQENNGNPKITIYPNPTAGAINFSENEKIIQIELFNSVGQIIENNWQTNNNWLDISHLQTGIYYIRIRTKDAEFTEKIIKR